MTNCSNCQRLHESVRILNDRIVKESAENLKYRNWFDENGAVLAVHKIGGFSFPEETTMIDEITITTTRDDSPEPKKV